MASATPLLFDSVFSAGFECSSHRRGDRRRLDLIASTHHDQFAFKDYERLKQAGMKGARDGLRWHLIEKAPGVYDWSSWRPMLQAAQAADIKVAWDICHYGWPDFYDIWSPKFVQAIAWFAEAAARVHAEHTDEPPIFCAVNEISFFAWGGGDVNYFNPFGQGRGDELKRQLVRASVAAIDAVRRVDPRAIFIVAEPLIHVAPHGHEPDQVKAAENYRQAQFHSTDMLLGLAEPDLGGRPDVIDVIGLNYYPHNQWYYQGPTIPMGHHEYRALAPMLLEVAERYKKPMFIAETGAEGSGRPAWMHYVCDEVRAAMRQGADIRGVCLYPVMEYPGWDNDRNCEVGLFGRATADGERPLHKPMLEEVLRQQALFEAFAGRL